MDILEHPGGKSRRGTVFGPRLQFAMPNGYPPPHDRQFYNLGGREHRHTVEDILAWTPPQGWTGKSVERLALEVIGQGVSVIVQDALRDEEVQAILTAWRKWAKAEPAAPAPAPSGKGA